MYLTAHFVLMNNKVLTPKKQRELIVKCITGNGVRPKRNFMQKAVKGKRWRERKKVPTGCNY